MELIHLGFPCTLGLSNHLQSFPPGVPIYDTLYPCRGEHPRQRPQIRFEEERRKGTKTLTSNPTVGRGGCLLALWYGHYLTFEANVGAGGLEMVAKGLFNVSVAINLDPRVLYSNSNCD